MLVAVGKVRITEHGYDELAADNIFARDAVEGIAAATIVEDYPAYPKGPCMLLLQKDTNGDPIHVLWGISKGSTEPAVLITAYRPNPDRWADGFTMRRR